MFKQRLKCPKCGVIFYVNALASNPPQYEGECCKGDFSLRYYDRKDSFLEINQEELDLQYEQKLQ